MRKSLRLTLLTVAAVLSVAGMAIVWLCYTASGLQFALLQLNRVPNLEVQVSGVSGRLAGPLHIDHITLNHQRVSIDVEQLDVDLTPAFLLSGLVKVKQLSAATATVTLKPSSAESNDNPIHFLPTFLRITVDRLDIRRAEYAHTNGYSLVATPLQAGVKLSRSRLRVRQLNVSTQDFDARGNGELRGGKVLQVSADLQADYKLPNGPILRGDLKADGPLTGAVRELQLNAQLHEPDEALVNAKLAFPDSGWSLQGKVTADKVLLDPWWPQPSFSLSRVDMGFDLGAAGMRYVGNVNVPEWSPALLHVDAMTHYAQRVFGIEYADVKVPQTGVHAHAAGSITLRADAKPLLDLQGKWTDLRWPLHADATQAVFSSAAGSMTLHGSQPYSFQVTGGIATPQWPESTVAARGEFRPGEIDIANYSLQTLQGTATGSALLGLNDAKPWQFSLRTRGVNPAALLAEWPGKLNIDATGKGHGFDSRVQFDVLLRSASGSLRDQVVKARGRLQRHGKRWTADDIVAQWGGAKLTAQGTAGPVNNLIFSLHAAELKSLYAPLAGDVDMSGTVSGPEATPKLSLSVRSTRLGYAELQTQNLQVDTQLDLTDGEDSHVDIKAGRFLQGTQGLQDVVLSGEGRMAAHRLHLQGKVVSPWVPEGSALSVQLAGNYMDLQWQGELNELSLTTSEQTVRLAQPAQLTLSSREFRLQELCLNINDGRACVQGSWLAERTGSSWRALANLRHVPLLIGNKALTDDARLQTRLDGQVQLSATPTAPWQGNAGLKMSDASIRYRSFTGRDEVLPISLGELQLTADAQAVQTAAELRIGEQTVATLDSKLDRSTDDVEQWPLSGVVGLSSSDAKLIPVFVGEVDKASGTLAAVLQLSGTVAAPRIGGNIRLLQGELDFYQLNLLLRGLQFDAQLETDRLHFTAQGNAGEGMMTADGDLQWHESQLSGRMNLKGERLLVADLPEYRVLASPNLQFDIDEKNVAVKGEVLIPEARLQPKEVIGAVQVSADARFKSDQALEAEGSPWTVTSDVAIRLGNQVNFDGLGLQGRLLGAVNTRLHTGDPAVGSGELSVANGEYEILGQKLDIKRGRLIYENTLLEDPGLDIQAERAINEITVGVNVRGALRAPRLQFYSTPSMSESQIVSYLLIGKPLDKLQSGEATTVRSASNSLAVSGGGYLASQIGRRIGLEQIGVETDANNQSSLVLGKFLSPRLFVSYGISLTEAINTVKARYKLSDHWVIKTEAGEAKSADIEFKIER